MSEQFQAFASAPGKVLWIGGYSVLERPNISFVTGVDKRVYARAGLKEGNLVELSAPQFKAGWQGPLEEINAAPAETQIRLPLGEGNLGLPWGRGGKRCGSKPNHPFGPFLWDWGRQERAGLKCGCRRGDSGGGDGTVRQASVLQPALHPRARPVRARHRPREGGQRF